jgi:hypothetical protein
MDFAVLDRDTRRGGLRRQGHDASIRRGAVSLERIVLHDSERDAEQ